MWSGTQILAVFDGAVAAIRCGCAIRDAVQGLGMAVRVGIHAGEVEYDDTTISGITVFTGVRDHGVAQPGEVLVSNTVKELVAGSWHHLHGSGDAHPQGAPRGVAALYARRPPESDFHVITLHKGLEDDVGDRGHPGGQVRGRGKTARQGTEAPHHA